MFGLQIPQGPKCHVCGMLIANSEYRKDDHGFSLYWANPKICEFTEVRLDFCGPICSTQWWGEQIEARKNVTPGN